MKTILITGGAGFIGAHLAKRLGQDGHELILVDNFNDYYDPGLKEARISELLKNTPHTLYRADLSDLPAMEAIFKAHQIDHIAHQGAQAGVRYSLENPFAYGESNLMGTLHILELAHRYGVKGITLASSSSVYGDAKVIPIKESDCEDKPISLYAATKRATEHMAHAYHHLYDMPITCLRYFTVYGPWGRPDMAYFKFLDLAYAGKGIDVYGQGKMARDFTYIDDIVEGITLSIEKNHPWAVLNLGRGHAEQLMDMISLIEGYTGITFEKTFLDMQPGDVRETWADTSQAKELLGWKPSVPLEEGLKRFVAWYKEYYRKEA